jgi:N-acetylglucosaminyl-diphospho-decaprenol L-rhamnosyltransferase
MPRFDADVRTQFSFPRIAAIVVNFRTLELTLGCLESLVPEISTVPGSRIVLVDSASQDGSMEELRRQAKTRSWEPCITFVQLGANSGFAAANNAGLAALNLQDFQGVLLANSDAVLRPGALRSLGELLAREPSVGLVGPALEWPCGTPQASCFQDISPLSELVTAARTGPLSRLLPRGEVAIHEPSPTARIDWISFACVLIRREVITSVGVMDDGFFMYFEDVDYCRRARAAGWRIAYVPLARVVHLRGGRSPDEFDAHQRQRRPAYYYRARARYLAKYYGRTGPWLGNACWLLGRGVSLARESVAEKPPHTAAFEAIDIWKGAFVGFSKDRPLRNRNGRLAAWDSAHPPA